MTETAQKPGYADVNGLRLYYERRGTDGTPLVLLGYSFGGSAALQTAIRHPARVRKLVLASIPFSSDGWFPEVREGFKHLGRALAQMMRPSPIYQTYAAVAPRPEHFPQLLDKMGELQTRSCDWSADVARLAMPAMLVYADADAIPPTHIESPAFAAAAEPFLDAEM
jgi:pimeloyl-ACP methyl ester carboxylesterase